MADTLRVLVLEDEPVQMQTIERILQTGFGEIDVSGYEDGQSALEAYRKTERNGGTFHLIISDSGLADGVAFNVLDSMAENGKRPPIILRSGLPWQDAYEGTGRFPLKDMLNVDSLLKEESPIELIHMVTELTGIPNRLKPSPETLQQKADRLTAAFREGMAAGNYDAFDAFEAMDAAVDARVAADDLSALDV